MPLVLINPEVELRTETEMGTEGCLSFPELLVLVPRFRAVRIDYLNVLGQPGALHLRDFPARVVQHELDHLDGVLTIDRTANFA